MHNLINNATVGILAGTASYIATLWLLHFIYNNKKNRK